MTAYQQFINNCPNLQQGNFARLWELKVNATIENLIDFGREFLKTQGLNYTGYTPDEHKAVFNNKYVFDGIIQDGNKIALRIIRL